MAKVGSYRWEGEVAKAEALERAALQEIDEALSADPTDDEIADLLDSLDDLDPPVYP
jgi:hypothetical protein